MIAKFHDVTLPLRQFPSFNEALIGFKRVPPATRVEKSILEAAGAQRRRRGCTVTYRPQHSSGGGGARQNHQPNPVCGTPDGVKGRRLRLRFSATLAGAHRTVLFAAFLRPFPTPSPLPTSILNVFHSRRRG